MVRPTIATKENEYVGEDCALCKQPFAPETELVVCPRDGALHHTYCWEENLVPHHQRVIKEFYHRNYINDLILSTKKVVIYTDTMCIMISECPAVIVLLLVYLVVYIDHS